MNSVLVGYYVVLWRNMYMLPVDVPECCVLYDPTHPGVVRFGTSVPVVYCPHCLVTKHTTLPGPI